MAYTLEAIVGSETVLQELVGREAFTPAVLVPLRQGVAIVPMTDQLLEVVAGGAPARSLGFGKLPAGYEGVLRGWSAVGPVGYVEAEYFGGVGCQRAALWAGGRLALGPLSVEEGHPWPIAGSPISQVLARLGVDRSGHDDEFDAVGLAEHRHTEDWQH